MDHLHATESQAAERYLLGELADADAAEFELHFFECPQCASAVESGQLFLTGARAHFRESEAKDRAKASAKTRGDRTDLSFLRSMMAFLESLMAFWRRPLFVVPVMAALGGVVVYQNAVVIPDLSGYIDSMGNLPATLLIGASRGESTVLHVRKGSRVAAVEAEIDNPSGVSFSRYECVLNLGGHEVFRTEVPAPEDGQPIALHLPARKLKPETYELVISGIGQDGHISDKISSYPFAVQFN